TIGVISGTPTAVANTSVTITVTDSASRTATRSITITISAVRITIGGPATSGSGQQPPLSITLSTPASVDVTGTLTLTFVSSVGGTDDMIRFSNGQRTIAFTIPAGSTNAVFSPANPTILTGTVAGTITLTASSTSVAGTPKTIVIDPAVPVIGAVALQQV